jgi:hypothetical protein
MRLKNRKIYGITSNNGLTNNLYVNFGESRYAYISYDDFIKNAHTWKFNISRSNTENWQPLLENEDKLPRAFYFDVITLKLIELMGIKNNFLQLHDKVLEFANGQFLIELGKFFKLHNGNIRYKNIKSYKKHTIKFNLNGVSGFSIWKGKTCLEDRIWSISRCEEIIKETMERKNA